MSSLTRTEPKASTPVLQPPNAQDNPDTVQVAAAASAQPEFKEGGYGWVVVVAVNLLNAHTWGINASYSVFLAYYLRSGAFAGASLIAYAFVGGLGISVALLVSPIATIMVREHGTRLTLLLGTVLETVSFIGASFTTQMWQLVLSQGIAFGLGMGFLFVASVGVVPQWFVKHRSLANGIATSGSGLGGLVYALATNAMIRTIGLPWSFRVLAVLVLVVNGICSLLIRDRNKQVGAVQVAFHLGLFRRPEYILLNSWALFSLLGYIVVVFSLADYCQTVGLSPSQGSIVAAMFNLSQGVGRPAIGYVSDSWGRINVAGGGCLIAVVASLTLWVLAGPFFAGALVYALLGAFTGILWVSVGPICAEVVGLQLLPSALSIIWIVLILPATFAEVIGLTLRSPGPNGYLHVQVFVGCTFALSFLSIWLLRAWKLWTLETESRIKMRARADLAASNSDEPGAADAANKAGVAQEQSKEPETLAAYLKSGRWVFSTQVV